MKVSGRVWNLKKLTNCLFASLQCPPRRLGLMDSNFSGWWESPKDNGFRWSLANTRVNPAGWDCFAFSYFLWGEGEFHA